MTFEEFFKKKKISVDLLQSSEPMLFAEFKSHYEQMGEKSFDHTKKYWFNPLRHKFPAPVEAKAEKVIIENQIAEQTITDSLTNPTSLPVTSVGVKPRFKAGMAAKPTEEKAEPEQSPMEAVPKPAGFKPRFKASMVNQPAKEKPEAETPADQKP